MSFDSSDGNLTLIDSPSLRDRVVERLQEMIFLGRLQPGQRLVETELADMLGVSRVPVREAINQLRTQGLVTTIPRRGSYVCETTARDVQEIYEIRKAVEIPAIETALEHLTDHDVDALDNKIEEMRRHADADDVRGFAEADVAFHRLTYAKCPNQRLLALVEHVAIASRMLIMRSITVAPVDLHEIAESHRVLRDAIESRNRSSVARVFRKRFDHDAAVFIERLEGSRESATRTVTA